MNSVYRYILKNKALDNITKNLIEGKSVVIVKKNNEIDDLISYFNDFIINTFDEVKLLERINEVKENNPIKKIKIKKMTVLKREITNNKNDILDIFSSFINKNEFGYSLNDLYSLTNKNIEFKDKEFEYYDLLNKSPIILNNEASMIISKIDELIKSGYVNLFVKYSKFKDSKRFDIIRDNIDKDDIDEIINKLSGVLNNTFAFLPPIYFNEYSSDFEREDIYYKDYNDEQLMDEVKKINERHNGGMLEEIVKIKWYNFFQIINYKKISNKNHLINENYKKIEEVIYNQYIENIDNLKMFANSFCFIKKIFKDEVMDSINKCIVSEEELYKYILYIKDTLAVYKEYLAVKEKVDALEDIQKELLEYHYEQITNKKGLIKLLEFIPRYYLYHYIECIEEENGKVINSYNELDKKLIRLNTALTSYNEILLSVLKEICDKNTLEFAQNNKVEMEKLDTQNMCSNRYSKDNISFLFKLFPILILDENEYKNEKDSIDDFFDVVVNSEVFSGEDDKGVLNDFVSNNESLDKVIIHLISNLGYHIYEKEDDKSIIYINSYQCKSEEKIIYINNKDVYTSDDLIELLQVIDEGKKIIFLWYRNWWLNRNEEVQNIQKSLLNNS